MPSPRGGSSIGGPSPALPKGRELIGAPPQTLPKGREFIGAPPQTLPKGREFLSAVFEVVVWRSISLGKAGMGLAVGLYAPLATL